MCGTAAHSACPGPVWSVAWLPFTSPALLSHADDIDRLSRQQRPPHGPATAKRVKVEQPAAVEGEAQDAPAAKPPRRRKAPDLSVLHSGALLLTIQEAGVALARGRTWIHDRINEGKLERPEGDTRITAASVRRLAGIED
jgi:hypothetical protein